MSTIQPTFKLWVIDSLKKKKLTQTKLAEKLDIDPTAIGRALTGERNFLATEIPVMARFLGVSSNTLVEKMTGIDTSDTPGEAVDIEMLSLAISYAEGAALETGKKLSDRNKAQFITTLYTFLCLPSSRSKEQPIEDDHLIMMYNSYPTV